MLTNFKTEYVAVPVTLTITSGVANALGNAVFPDGRMYGGVNAFGNSRVVIAADNITQSVFMRDSTSATVVSGTVNNIDSYDNSLLSINGGNIVNARFYGNKSGIINAGTIENVVNNNNSAADISGGNVTFATYAAGSSHFNISGGTFN